MKGLRGLEREMGVELFLGFEGRKEFWRRFVEAWEAKAIFVLFEFFWRKVKGGFELIEKERAKGVWESPPSGR